MKKTKDTGSILIHSRAKYESPKSEFKTPQAELAEKNKGKSKIRWRWTKNYLPKSGSYTLLLAYNGKIFGEAKSEIEKANTDDKAQGYNCVFVLNNYQPLDREIPLTELTTLGNRSRNHHELIKLDDGIVAEYEKLKQNNASARLVSDASDEESQKNIARKKLSLAQWERPEQQRFRKQILENYNYKCAVTKCATQAALEAAHIRVLETDEDGIRKDSNSLANGILLRSDIHALFDAFLITLSEDGTRIEATPEVLADPTYNFLQASNVTRPDREPPSADNIRGHRERYHGTVRRKPCVS